MSKTKKTALISVCILCVCLAITSVVIVLFGRKIFVLNSKLSMQAFSATPEEFMHRDYSNVSEGF